MDAAVQFLVVQQRLLQPFQMLAYRCSRSHPPVPVRFFVGSDQPDATADGPLLWPNLVLSGLL
jgi:hypothetical protein